MSAALLDGFDSSSGESEGESLLQLWHVDALLLQVGILPDLAGRVELGSTSSVGEASTHNGPLLIYWAYLSHSGQYSNIKGGACKCPHLGV